MNWIEEIAELLHNEQCTRRICRWSEPCSHSDFYRTQAVSIYRQLEPEIGAGNLLHVLRVILLELW